MNSLRTMHTSTSEINQLPKVSVSSCLWFGFTLETIMSTLQLTGTRRLCNDRLVQISQSK